MLQCGASQCQPRLSHCSPAQLRLDCVHCAADSIPFVAITLLTSTEGMRGGETVLQKGDGTEMSVSFPKAGYLIVLQVHLLSHMRSLARL